MLEEMRSYLQYLAVCELLKDEANLRANNWSELTIEALKTFKSSVESTMISRICREEASMRYGEVRG